ncbi:MAG: hypothetical protein M3133_04495 [Actinomycetota bacterium]|nr:hypothetical protein [Actinomycetota bacterium]
MGRFKSPIIAAVASAGLTAALVGGVAIAQTSTNSEIIACVAENSGNVRIVTITDDCKANENDLRWNQQGLQGPPGADGADGVAQRTEVISDPVTVPPLQAASQSALCPDELQVLGGGHISTASVGGGQADGLAIVTSRPLGNLWQVTAVNPRPSENLTLRVYAVCAAVS